MKSFEDKLRHLHDNWDMIKTVSLEVDLPKDLFEEIEKERVSISNKLGMSINQSIYLSALIQQYFENIKESYES